MDVEVRENIAPSFADIFKNNCYKNGILPVVLDVEVVEVLMREIEASESYQLTVNLENQQVETPNDQTYGFDIGDFEKYCLLNGLDEIGWTLQFESLISQYEAKS